MITREQHDEFIAEYLKPFDWKNQDERYMTQVECYEPGAEGYADFLLEKYKNNGWLDPRENPLVIWREAEGDELDPELDAGDLVGDLTHNGKGEFIAAIWILCPGGDYWSTLKCRLNDEDASLEEFDGLEFVPCGWDLEDIQFYFPIPELPQFPPLSAIS